MALMLEAIDGYMVRGVATTLPFGKFVFEHEAFRSGHFNTHFVKEHYLPETLRDMEIKEARMAALMAVAQFLKDQQQLRLPIQ
jgi:propionyl-CoA carboxylase alpha chain